MKRSAVQRTLFSLAVAILIGLSCVSGATDMQRDNARIDGLDTMSPTQAERKLADAYPSNYYLYAARMWNQGQRDKAIFWLYVGEVRFRFLLAAQPNDAESGGSALFASLRSTIGGPVFEYATSVRQKWAAGIRGALAWDQIHPNSYTSKVQYQPQWLSVRADIQRELDEVTYGLREPPTGSVHSPAGELTSVPTVDWSRSEKMPATWPALKAVTTTESLVGVFKTSIQLSHAFFVDDSRTVVPADRLEISVPHQNALLVRASRGDQQLAQREIVVHEQEGALVFTAISIPDYLEEGTISYVIHLRATIDGELVVTINSTTRGIYKNKNAEAKQKFTEDNVLWFRARRLTIP